MAGFIASLGVESDRAIPVILYSYLDQVMADLLRAEINPTVAEAMLNRHGALGGSGARIDFAEAVYWLGEDLAADLHLLRKIRNHFAHTPNASFNDDRIRDLVANHQGRENFLAFLRDNFPHRLEANELVDHAVFEDMEDFNGGARTRIERTIRGDFLLAGADTLARTVISLTVVPAATRLLMEVEHIWELAGRPSWVDDVRTAVTQTHFAAWKAEGIRQGVVTS